MDISTNNALLKWYDSNTSNSILDYNCWHNASNQYHYDLDSGYYPNLSAFQSGTGQGIHSITADPLFKDMENGDSSLQASSPCREAGTYVGLAQDFNGTIVPQGLRVDIGAFEYEITLLPPQNFRIIEP
jgi:hypothetical protein